MIRILSASLIVLGLTLPAVAQQAAGGDGHALDANPQVGSGGVNSAAPQIDYGLRNDLVTGNVTGDRAFRGDIGYTAPGEFRGGLGSDTVFDFNARSLPPAGGGYNAAGGSVYREYASPSGLSRFNPTGSPVYYDGGTRLVLPGAAGAAGRDAALAGSPFAGQAVNRAGATSQTSGQAGAFTESPILGVRSIARSTQDDASAAPRTDPDSIDSQTGQATDRAQQVPAAPLYRPVTGFEAARTLDPSKSESGEAEDKPAAAGPAPTLGLGRRLEPGRATDRRDGAFAQQVYDTIFKSNTGVAAGQSAYGALLRDVQAGKSGAADPWSTQLDLPEPDAEQLRQAERAALEATRKAYGLSPAEAADESAEAGGESSDPALGELVETLNYNLPAIVTMAGQERTRANELIRQAEAAMSAGDFFEAEGFYKQARMYVEDDPMIRVGLAHAQLGAGMFRSASLSLRRLFEQHPELIAARYDAALLPSQDRLRWVQGELNKLADDPQADADPGLVMAYVGYQIGSRQLVRYGLALTQSLNPTDPLLPVLRRIWLDDSDASSEAAPVSIPAQADPTSGK